MLLQEALSALSISSFLERRYSLRSKTVATAASSTVALCAVKATRDVLVVVVNAAAQVLVATSKRAYFDIETILVFLICGVCVEGGSLEEGCGGGADAQRY